MRRPDRRVPDPRFHVTTFPRAAELRRRLPRLLVGVPLLGIGIAMTVEAQLGVSPFDVLHQGISERTGLSFGTVVIALGIVILVLWVPVRQRPGIGTLLNTLTVGLVIDAALRLLPGPDVMVGRVGFLVGGVVVTALGMGCYIGAGLGPGPRDGLMTGIAAWGPRVWVVRTVLEVAALAVGWALGGRVGIGTLVFALSIGPLGQFFLHRFHLGEPLTP